jgi:hypothetical protein
MMPDKQHFLVDCSTRPRLLARRPVPLRDISIARDGRIGLFQHPTEIVFPAHKSTPARLRFAIGMLASVWDRMQSPVEFSIALRDLAGTETPCSRAA